MNNDLDALFAKSSKSPAFGAAPTPKEEVPTEDANEAPQEKPKCASQNCERTIDDCWLVGDFCRVKTGKNTPKEAPNRIKTQEEMAREDEEEAAAQGQQHKKRKVSRRSDLCEP